MGAVEFIENYFKLSGKDIKLYSYQKKYLKDNAPFRFINKTRRAGISRCIAWEALYRAMSFPNTWAAIVSVSDNAAKDVMTYIYDAFYSFRDTMIKLGKPKVIPHIGVHTKSDLRFPQMNSRIESLPNNPRTVRGKTITDLYLDEFAHYQSADEMYGAILPSITLDREGIISKCTFISTPLAKFGPFYKFWANRTKPEYNHISYHTIHWKDCPALKSKIGLIKKSMDDDQFRREYCNEFVDETLAALPFDEIKACIDYHLTNEYDYNIKNPIYVGVDYGKVRDSTVIVVIEKIEDLFIVRHIKEFTPPSSYKEAAQYIIRNVPKWKPSRIIIDHTGVGESTMEDLSELGSLVKGETLTQPYKERIFAFTRLLFQDRKIQIPNNENLINQLHSLQKKITETGMVRYTHPAKGLIQHDDYVWALCLALYAGEQGSSSGGGVMYLKKSTWNLKKDDDYESETFKY